LYFLPLPQGHGAFRHGFLWTLGCEGVSPLAATDWRPFVGFADACPAFLNDAHHSISATASTTRSNSGVMASRYSMAACMAFLGKRPV